MVGERTGVSDVDVVLFSLYLLVMMVIVILHLLISMLGGPQSMRCLQAAFITAATGAGISDASKLADMILYAGHASQIPVKRSGQSAFSWVPLLAVAVTAQSKASPDSRSDALSLTIQGLVSVRSLLHVPNSTFTPKNSLTYAL